MSEVTQTNEPVGAVPEPPVFRMTTKVIQFEAPSSSGLPLFKAAMTTALETLKQQEQFQTYAGDSEQVGNTREAIQTIHSVLTGISVVAQANLTEFEAYQQAVAVYRHHQAQFGITIAQQASASHHEDGNADEE